MSHRQAIHSLQGKKGLLQGSRHPHAKRESSAQEHGIPPAKRLRDLRVALCQGLFAPGRMDLNVKAQLAAVKEAEEAGAQVVLFPLLSLTGASLGSLVNNPGVLQAAEAALLELKAGLAKRRSLVVTSLPLSMDGQVFPSLVLLLQGVIQGVIPLPVDERYPWLRPYAQAGPYAGGDWLLEGRSYPVIGNGHFYLQALPWLSFQMTASHLAFDASSPALIQVLYDSAPGSLGHRERTAKQISALSEARRSAVLSLSSSQEESSSAASFTGHRAVAEAGQLLARSKDFSAEMLLVDLDLAHLEALRHSEGQQPSQSFAQPLSGSPSFAKAPYPAYKPLRRLAKHPFLPHPTADAVERQDFCESVFGLAAHALNTRLKRVGSHKLVLGLSGGLDSCLALMIALRAARRRAQGPEEIFCYLLPAFASSDRTQNNARRLAKACAVPFEEISLRKSLLQHFEDIGQDPDLHDLCYENAQARERSQVLMNLANRLGALVLGTGDLSEIALGWSTYGADQLSMFNVNAGIPKTMARYLCAYEAERYQAQNPELADLLFDIIDTPISPELLPGQAGEIAQKTEDVLGPYELHDFFLWHLLARHASPSRILELACHAFADSHAPAFIESCLRRFLKRFVRSAFKRQAAADGSFLGPVKLSQSLGFEMPSDLHEELLLADLDRKD